MSPESKPRPDRDRYFMGIAMAVRARANCRGNHVGAILVLDGHVVSTGYNGTPSDMVNCEDGGCDRSGGSRHGHASVLRFRLERPLPSFGCVCNTAARNRLAARGNPGSGMACNCGLRRARGRRGRGSGGGGQGPRVAGLLRGLSLLPGGLPLPAGPAAAMQRWPW